MEVEDTSASKSEVDKPPSTPDMSAHDAEALLQNKGLVTPTCVTVDKEKMLLSLIVTQMISVTNSNVTIVRFIVAQYMCSCLRENVLQSTCTNTYNVVLYIRKCVTTIL